MPFVDRTPRKIEGQIDPYLEWKVRLFVTGAGLALAAMYFDIGWLMAVAALLLVSGFALRFLTRRHAEALRRESGEWDEEWDEEEEDHPAH